jgi:carboxyl-terminal processing protease
VTRRLAASLVATSLLLPACASRATRSAGEPATEPVPVAAPAAISAPAIAPAATFDSVWHIVHRTHWDTTFNGVPWRALGDSLRPQALAARSQAELRDVLNALVLALGQSHFAVLPGDDVSMTDADEAAATGTLGLEVRWLVNEWVITRVQPDGPAARAGLQPGTRLLAVNDTALPDPTLGVLSTDPRRIALQAYRLSEARLGGAVGTPARVRVLGPFDPPSPRELTLTRARPAGTPTRFGQLPTQHAELTWERRRVDGRQVGVIRFNIWMPALARAFDVALDSLRGADALVLDLRGNFGGVAGMAMGFAGHLVDTAVPVGVMHTRAQTMRFTINPRRVNTAAQRVTPFAGPVALVVDALSASTTEIFVGGLQDLGRARVFGEPTAGQALPAVAERLPNGDVLYHAIADFRAPSGRALEGAGVTPDEPVPVTRAALAAGRDPALDRALAWAAHAEPPGRVVGTAADKAASTAPVLPRR